MTANVGSIDRIIRVIFGLALIAWALNYIFPNTGWNWVGWIGVVPILTAIIGTCPGYSLLDLSTSSANKWRGSDRLPNSSAGDDGTSQILGGSATCSGLVARGSDWFADFCLVKLSHSSRIEGLMARNVVVQLSDFRVRRGVVMIHEVRFLSTTVYADEYLAVQIKRLVGWLNQFEQ
jgi:hypothetical protein